MALIKCRGCGREVSESAPSFPDCGRPTITAGLPSDAPSPVMVNKPTLARGKGCADLLLALVVVIAIAPIDAIS